MNLPDELTLPEVRRAFQDVHKALNPLVIGQIELNGGRVIGAGKPIGPKDYVRRFDLESALAGIEREARRRETALTSMRSVRVGAFDTRGSAVAHNSTIFLALDLDHIGWVATGGVWQYVLGTRYVDQADIATFTAVLGANDAGCMVAVEDYGHTLVWTGSALTWRRGDDESGYYRLCDTAPTGPGWQIADGSTVARLNADGSTSNITDWDVTTARYLKGGHSNAGVEAAGGTVANESAHTHTVGGQSATEEVDNDLALSTVQVASDAHVHTVSAGSAHNHAAGTLELARATGLLYYRR
jgi:hypothetical protein